MAVAGPDYRQRQPEVASGSQHGPASYGGSQTPPKKYIEKIDNSKKWYNLTQNAFIDIFSVEKVGVGSSVYPSKTFVKMRL